MTSPGQFPLPNPAPFLTPELPALKPSGRTSQGPFLPKVRFVCTLATTTIKVWSSLGLVIMQNTHGSAGQGPPIYHRDQLVLPDVVC